MCNASSKLHCQWLQKIPAYVVSCCTADKKEVCHFIKNVCSWQCFLSHCFMRVQSLKYELISSNLEINE